jgi:hypothetical protein
MMDVLLLLLETQHAGFPQRFPTSFIPQLSASGQSEVA